MLPMLGANDYSLAYADVYATFMNEETTESNEKFEEFMTIKRGKSNFAAEASHEILVTEEDLQAYRSSYESTKQAETTANMPEGDLLPLIYSMPGMIGGVKEPTMLRTLLDSGTGKTLINLKALPSNDTKMLDQVMDICRLEIRLLRHGTSLQSIQLVRGTSKWAGRDRKQILTNSVRSPVLTQFQILRSSYAKNESQQQQTAI